MFLSFFVQAIKQNVVFRMAMPLIAFAIVAAIPADVVFAQTIKPVSWWEDRAKSTLSAEETSISEMIRTANVQLEQIYRGYWSLNGILNLFRATGKTEYLEKGLEWVERFMATAHDVGGGYKGWKVGSPGVWGDSWDTPGITHQHLTFAYGGRVWALIADEAYKYPAYRARADVIRDFLEKNYWQRFHGMGPTAVMYREVTHITSHSAIIAMFLRDHAVSPTVRSQAQTFLDNFDHNGIPSGQKWSGNPDFRGVLRNNPSNPAAWIWPGSWNSVNGTTGNDVSHGGALVTYMMEAMDRGYGGWSANVDGRRLYPLFDVLYSIDPDNPSKGKQIWNYLSGPYASKNVMNAGTDGWRDGVSRLGRFEAATQQRIEAAMEANNDRTLGNMGNGALSAKILLGTGGGGGGAQCGNNVCEAGESRTSCPADCGGEVTCQNAYTNSTAIPNGYGASYNLFSSSRELLVKGKMCSDTSYGVEVGSGGNQYVYKTGYQWTGSQWQSVTLTSSSQLQSNLWYTGSATFSATPRTGGTYVVGYVCQQVDGVWKCGCKDTQCSTGYWQMQRVSR